MNKTSVAPKQIPALTVALIVVALLLPGVQLLVRGANSVTGEVLNKNWRGAFDILVTAKEFEQQVSPGKNEFDLAFLDPNYGGVAAPPLARKQVAQVAQLAGVEVAAPLGYVGTQVNPNRHYNVMIPWSEFETEKKRIYRLSSLVVGSDGLAERIEHKTTNIFEIDVANWNGRYGDLQHTAEHGVKAYWLNFGSTFKAIGNVTPAGVWLAFLEIPTMPTSIAAVDPAAEIKLLGAHNEFTKSLNYLQQADEILSAYGVVTAANFETWTKTHPAAAQQLEQMPGVRQLQNFAKSGSYGFENELVPYIHSNKTYPTNYVKTKFELEDGQGHVVEQIGETQVDLAALYQPFGVYKFSIPFPNTTLAADSDHSFATPLLFYQGVRTGSLTLKSRVDEDGAPGFEVIPKQISNLVMQRHSDYEATGYVFGDIRDYRSSAQTKMLIGTLHGKGVAPYNVGSYSPENKSAFDIYTPLGLYENAPVRTKDGKIMEPSRTGAGIALESANVIVSLNTAEKMVEGDYITSVRVRVAGL